MLNKVFLFNQSKFIVWPIFALSLYLLFSYLILNNGHLHEDAYITLNYVENIVEGNGITYFKGGPRAEGISDPLWVIMISALNFIGINIGIAIAIMNSLGVFLISYLSIKVSSEYLPNNLIHIIGLGTLFIILSSPISAVGFGGFSTLLYASLITLIFYLQWKAYYKKLFFIPWIGLIISIFRPDGIFIGITSTITTLFYIFLNYNNDYLLKKNYLKQCIITFIIGLLFFLIRYSYFDNIFPLPFYIKTASGENFAGLQDTVKWFLLIIPFIPLIIFPGIINQDRIRFLLSCISPILIILAFIFINPLQNYGLRFQNSIFGIVIILYFYFFSFIFSFLLKNYFNLVYFSIISTFIFVTTSIHISRWALEWEIKFLTNNDIINYLPFELRKYTDDNTRIALTEAGKMAYWTKGKKLDLVGLNTTEIAKKRLKYKHIENFNPQLIFLHTNDTTNVSSCKEKDYKKISYNELSNIRTIYSINWREINKPPMRAPGAAIEYILQQDNFEVYLLCFLGHYSHLIAFRDKEIILESQLLEILESIKDDKSNLSYLKMSYLIDN